MKKILAEISVGELLDKLTILEIKLEKISDKESLKIILESRAEIRRVVWPTRTETTQTVIIVVIAIIVCALLLWGLDSLFGWATAKLLG